MRKPTPPNPPAAGRPGSLPWPKKLLYAALTTAAFFLLLESTLALIGVRPVLDTRDPFVGFASQVPLFEESTNPAGASLMSTAANKRVWFNAQTFPKTKPAGSYRIFCLGGSTTYGRPYSDLTSYPGWLREFLPAADPTRQWEVINAGGVSYASYRVAAVMEELVEFQPDLFIVYTAHNEFLERRTYQDMFQQSELTLRASSTLSRTRTWALTERLVGRWRTPPGTSPGYVMPGEVDEMLNHTVGPADYHRDDQWRRQVLRHYEQNLNRLVALARNAGAQILFITPVSNLKDCAPFKSELSPQLSEAEARQFWDHIQHAQDLIDEGLLEPALLAYQRAQQLDGRHAELLYEMGRLLLQLNRKQEARRHFELAVDEDICPLRAVREIPQLIRQVAQQRKAPLLDYERLLRKHCERQFGHDCLGAEQFLDHVHPTVEEHRRLALWLVDALRDEGVLSRDQRCDPEAIAQIANLINGRVDRREQGVALRNMAKVLHWAGKYAEAGPIAQRALEHLGDDSESLYLAAECLALTDRGREALPYYRRLLEVDVAFWRAYIPLGVLLSEKGDYAAAKQHLSVGVQFQPENVYGQRELGVSLVQLGEFAEALEPLQKANELQPKDARTLYFLARAKAESGRVAEAIQLFRETLLVNGNDATALNHLGLLLLQSHQLQEAVDSFEAALRASPDFEEAAINLQIANEQLAAGGAERVAPSASTPPQDGNR